MKIYNTQAEVEADIKDDVLTVNGDVTFKMAFLRIEASIVVIAGDIKAGDIKAWDIKAWDINARDIKAGDIKAWDINARDINARDINARDINARDINARDINARDINARDILFYAVCSAYTSFNCKSIAGRRNNAKYFCLDGKVVIDSDKKPEPVKMTVVETAEKLGHEVEIIK